MLRTFAVWHHDLLRQLEVPGFIRMLWLGLWHNPAVRPGRGRGAGSARSTMRLAATLEHLLATMVRAAPGGAAG